MKRFEWAYYVNSYRLCVSKEREKSSSMSFVYVLTWDMNWWMIWVRARIWYEILHWITPLTKSKLITRKTTTAIKCVQKRFLSLTLTLFRSPFSFAFILYIYLFFSFKKISILIPLVKTKYVNIKKISLNSVNWIHLLFWFCTSFYFLCEWKSCKYIVPFYFIFLL